jgi:hypothetical protein
VPDERLEPLAKVVKTDVIVPATVEFVDIAGLGPRCVQGRRPRQSIPCQYPRDRRRHPGRPLF